ncbi:hypothetical protein N7493_008028 [Penicillium malachiteum]|uniref:Uncharacterized protein n=1 Tax=Penicillium malachiteum TaxID=1324776 RepID=A0AAD6HGW1_9EURO|nr:hypothetical protein N7493_008028 [Penicillium malachiteum]
MSRNFITGAATIVVGVFTGYYTFQPAFQELAIQRAHGIQPGSSPDNSASKQNTDSPASNTPAQAPAPVAPGSEKSN